MVTSEGGVLEFSSSGEYHEERLYILEGVKRQEKKLDAALKEVAIAKYDLVKYRADLNEAHGRVRSLMKSRDEISRRLLRMEIKSGSIASLVGLASAGAIEFLRHYLAK